MADVQGLHVVYSQILSISDHPFSVMSQLRPVWHRVFHSRCCFGAIDERVGKSYLSGNAPTIPGLGSICLDPSAALLRDKYNAGQLVDSLCHCSPRSDQFSSHPIFGYNPVITDQRMNFLYFQTTKPLRLRGSRSKGYSASGEMYAHVYPNGYIIMFVSISYPARINLEQVPETLAELDPVSDHPDRWTWTSRFGIGSLAKVVQKVKLGLQHSLFHDQAQTLREGSWYSAVRFSTSATGTEIIKALVAKHRRNQIILLDDFRKDREHRKELLIDRSSFILTISKESSDSHFYASRSRRLFWKMILLSSCVRISKSVYEDYLTILHFDILALRAERLSVTRKLLHPRSLRLSMYDYVIPLYVSIIDAHVRNAAPFHRWLYTALSKTHGTDARRGELLLTIKDWETELAQWETWYSSILRQLFSPLKHLLGFK
jgi:hypothetical protein